MSSRVREGDRYSDEFGVGVGIHQGSVLSPLLFIIVLEALSSKFHTGCQWELLHAEEEIRCIFNDNSKINFVISS